MEITILGSGTVTPSPTRNSAGNLIVADSTYILVDIGPGTVRRLCDARVDHKLIDGILITHFHPDHVADLVSFLFATNYAFGPIREEPFRVCGPRGLEQFYAGLVAVYGDWIVPRGNRLDLLEMSTEVFDETTIGAFFIRSAPARHSDAALSYRITDGRSTVVVSGDTDVSDVLVDLAGGADVLISECSMPEGWKVPGHLVPSEAGSMAAMAGVRRLVLTHMYPPCDDVDVVEQASQAFSGEIVKAADLMMIRV